MKARKCDTVKYRRRRKKERQSHAEREKRRQVLDRERMIVLRMVRERQEKELRELKHERKRLVQVLANHLYLISPPHAAEARVRQLFQIMDILAGDAGLPRERLFSQY